MSWMWIGVDDDATKVFLLLKMRVMYVATLEHLRYGKQEEGDVHETVNP